METQRRFVLQPFGRLAKHYESKVPLYLDTAGQLWLSLFKLKGLLRWLAAELEGEVVGYVAEHQF